MSYVSKKLKVFDHVDTPELNRKKSDGRMKTYASAYDARAWCDHLEERRQYILDIVTHGDGNFSASGRIIPLQALIDIMLVAKIEEIKSLQREIQALRDFIKSHGLHLDDDQFLAMVKPEVAPKELPEVIDVYEKPSVSERMSAKGMPSVSSPEKITPQVPSTIDVEKAPVGGPTIEEESIKEPSIKIQPVAEPSIKEQSIKESTIKEESIKEPSIKIQPVAEPSIKEQSIKESTIKEESIKEPSIRTQPVAEPSTKEQSIKESTTKEESIKEPSIRTQPVAEPSIKEQSIKESTTKEEIIKEPSIIIQSVAEPSIKEEIIQEEPAKVSLEIGKEPSSTIVSVKEMAPSRKESAEKSTRVSTSSRKEIISIEDTLDIDDEYIIADQEIVEAAREKARSGQETLVPIKESKIYTDMDAFESEIPTTGPVIEQEMKEQEPRMGDTEVAPSLEEKALAKIEDMIEISEEACLENYHMLLFAIEQLETIHNIVAPEEKTKRKSIETFHSRKSAHIEETLAEGDDLTLRLDRLKNLDDMVLQLKLRADRCGELDTIKVEKTAADLEIERLRCKCNEESNINDKLEMQVYKMEMQLEEAQLKAHEADVLRVENSCLKVRVDNLGRIHIDYEDLLEKTKGFETIKAEWAIYKAQCENNYGLEQEIFELRLRAEEAEALDRERQNLMKQVMDCECCIDHQGTEIEKLQCHIECLSKNMDKKQDQVKDSCTCLRAQIAEKDQLIRASDQKLQEVQKQLRSSIECVTCETTCLRNRIVDLEKELATCSGTKQQQEMENDLNEIQRASCQTICLNNYINELEEELATLRDKCDENECLREYIKDLKIEIAEYETTAKDLKAEITSYQSDYQDSVKEKEQLKKLSNDLRSHALLESSLAEAKINLEKMEIKLEEMIGENQKLKEQVGKLGSAGGDDHFKNMLKQERYALKCIMDKFCDMQLQQDALRKQNDDNITKIEQLEIQLGQARSTIDCLQICNDDEEKDNIIQLLRQKLQLQEEALAQQNDDNFAKVEQLEIQLGQARSTIDCLQICNDDEEKDNIIQLLRQRLLSYEASDDCSCTS